MLKLQKHLNNENYEQGNVIMSIKENKRKWSQISQCGHLTLRSNNQKYLSKCS